MIGTSVEYIEGEESEPKTGTVSKVLIEDGGPKLVLAGMMDYEAISVNNVSSVQRGESISQLGNQDTDPERRVQKSLGK